MIKACSTTLIKNNPVEEGLTNFDGIIANIELRIREGHFSIEERNRIENLKRLAKKHHISIISLHQAMKSLGTTIDLSSPDKWIRNFSLRDAEKTVIAADILGARRVIVHPSDVIIPDEFEAREQNLINSLSELIETANKYGVKIYIENLRNGKMGNSLNWLLSLRKKFDGELEICFDTGHWLISKRDSEDFNHFTHYHIHDNNGARDEHLFPGEGIFPWDKIDFPNDAVVVYELIPEENPEQTLRKIAADKR